MTEPVALDHTAAAPPRPSDPLAFTAAGCSVMGLVFLPLAPFGLLVGLAAAVNFRRRTPTGRTMTIVAILAGLIGSAGLVAVFLWLRNAEPMIGVGGK